MLAPYLLVYLGSNNGTHYYSTLPLSCCPSPALWFPTTVSHQLAPSFYFHSTSQRESYFSVIPFSLGLGNSYLLPSASSLYWSVTPETPTCFFLLPSILPPLCLSFTNPFQLPPSLLALCIELRKAKRYRRLLEVSETYKYGAECSVSWQLPVWPLIIYYWKWFCGLLGMICNSYRICNR